MDFQKGFNKESKNFKQDFKEQGFKEGFRNDFITDEEVEEFKQILRNHNFQENDFEFFGKEDKFNKSKDEFADVSGSIAITFKPTGKQKIYRSSKDNKWTFEFQKDLSRGFFQ
jgi:hypothetical protein